MFELGKLFGDAWAGVAPWADVSAVRRQGRQTSSLPGLDVPKILTVVQFEDDPAQAEADFWDGFVAGVNDLVEGTLDSQDRMRQANEFQIDDDD